MIPVSTAVWDPQWYHDFKGSDHTFLDKRGVVNGLRCEELYPNDSCNGANQCDDSPTSCTFLQRYRKQIFSLDFDTFMKRAEESSDKIKEQLGFKEEPVVVLIVYETPSNPCSERQVLIDYFTSHGVDCKELDYPIN